MLHPSHWLVWLMDWFEFTDLPQLQSLKLGYAAFSYVQSVVFDSDWMDGLMIQICLNYNPFDLIEVLFMVMVVMIDRRLALHPSTTITHWQCEVRLNELMNEQIFLHWQNSKEIYTTFIVSAQWFWRVWIWRLIDVDIPQLSSYGINFGDYCFGYTYSLQSSSTHSPISSSFDAAALESYIKIRSRFL